MNYASFLKKEIEKVLFVEIKENLTLNMDGYPVLEKGEYPILPADLIKMGKTKDDALTPSIIIDGMLNIIGCDKAFIHNSKYISFLRSVKAMESYVIMQIGKLTEEEQKKKLILVNALVELFPKQDYLYNRVVILMKLYEKSSLGFIEDEIAISLEQLTIEYPEFLLPYFHLGKYYIKKDMDRAKIYLRKCLEDHSVSELGMKKTAMDYIETEEAKNRNYTEKESKLDKTKVDQSIINSTVRDEAYRLLEGIRGVENYDHAVELVKNGQGLEALKILLPIIDNDYEEFDARYYAAVAYRQVGNITKALMYLKELTNFAERAEVYSEIGINLAELEDFEGALVYFKKALKITPDDSGILCNIGACQLNLSNYEEAKKTFELASRLNPKDEIPKKWLMVMSNEAK